ncbi:adenine-specific DNA-methyltransferase [Plasticicumulans lactativorans]|uniref:site-specific DNA-methyltransferase (adenine-specific) n=1 Tax=Plasticicumulans lactativorans TaxID=1133106 RepID=A0A4R2L7H0_9GAMM|nr:site-specific DNA-methyltransferase [Plasticicumulans lactativorans]TCO81918.1 adenine-specific DNA-methyltransferase [Plasticicumulans lactativorans]
MDKLKMHSPNLTQDNIARIRELFPGCVTEAKGEDGSVKLAVDFDQLRQELADSIVEGPQERYHLNWPGKREALLAANAPIAKTLRPCRDESVDFDTTKNLFIEGDNLDALKLLQETYLGKVKMIYIDPPYNTGRDFVYDDDFAENAESFLIKSLQTSPAGERLVANPESNGRFHSDWLSMMYARVRLAKALLADDGVFLASIDDGEVSNLRKICDEIFGEEQFAAQIIWKKRNTPPNDKVIGAQHDYILLYVKSNVSGINLRPRTQDQIDRYKNPDNHPKGPWVAGDLTGNVKGGRYSASLYYPIVNPNTGEHFYPPNNGNWRFNREKVERLIAEDSIYFGKDGKQSPKLKRFLSEVKEGATWTSLWDFAPFNTSGSNEMGEIFNNSTLFENPKPIGLLEHILELGSSPDAIVVDFFAGASSTAHAVMKKNAEDGGRRRFVMVQLPEPCPGDSEAANAGYKTIAEVSKERIRRASKKISQSNPQVDTGFRVLKIDTSNIADIYYAPDALDKAHLDLFVDNIKPDRTAEDLLFQVMLDWGVDLALPVARESIQGKEVFFVDGNALAASFDAHGGNDETFVKELAKRQPLRVVFRDAGFKDSAVKINVEQIFKLLSPATEVKCI